MSVTKALTRHLSNPDMFEHLDRIDALNGAMHEGTFRVVNPSTGETLA